MLHSIEVLLPVVKVVLKGPVAVVTEVSFPHLSSGRAASVRPGNHQTDPRRPAMPALGTEDPRFTAPASKGEELKSFSVGRQRKRRDPIVYILVHQRLVRQHLLHVYGRTGSDLHFLPPLPKAMTPLLKEFFPECAGVQITQSRDPREPTAHSHHLHQERCSRNHPTCK